MSGPCWGLPPYPESNEPGPARLPEDQVKRLRRFEAAYPEVEIQRPDFPRETWWRAVYEGRRVASDTELRGLLDTLESLFGGAP